MMIIFYFIILLTIISLLYLLIWPIVLRPEKWSPPTYFHNNDLNKSKELKISHFIYTGEASGPEDICFDSKDRLYTSTSDGSILRFTPPDYDQHKIFANTKGRPLGIMLDKNENLIVADAHKGLLSIDKVSREITCLSNQIDDLPFYFTNNLDIDSQGRIYFSDSSTRFTMGEGFEEVLEHSFTGRLMVYDPQKQSTLLLMDGIAFANGVALAQDESFVLVSEVSEYRVRRYWLKGEKKGQNDIFIGPLPGMPDNITRDINGIFWVGLPAPRAKLLDKLAQKPFWRKVIYRLPGFIRPKAKREGMLLGIDQEGTIKYHFFDPSGETAFISGATEYQGKVYAGSPSEERLVVLSK